MINGTQLMLACSVMALERLERIADWADAVCAWSLEAWHGRMEPFDPAIHQVRNQSNAELVARNVTDWLKGSVWQDVPRTQVQDPYSFRCTPQVHGASRNSLATARAVLENEVNAVTDNPLIFPEQDKMLSGAIFTANHWPFNWRPSRWRRMNGAAFRNAGRSSCCQASKGCPLSSLQIPVLTAGS